MSVPQFQHAVVVLGMHRSGTSALAGLLGLAGLGMPRTLLVPSSGNEKGLWESEAIKSFNEGVLKVFGSSWHGVEAISLSNLTRPAIGRLRKAAKAIVTEEYSSSAVIALKDPRLCRLLPLWQPVLSELSVRTTYSIILRNPLEVAQSLAHRNEFDPEIGALLWARYLLDAEVATRGSRRIFLTFDRLLTDWLTEITRVVSELELPIDPELIDAEQAGDFLESGLRHHRIADKQVFAELQNMPQVSEVYRILLGWAHDRPESDVDHQMLDRIRQDLDRMGSVIASVAERARLDRKRLTSAKARSEETASELARAKRASDDLEAVKAGLAAQSEAQARLEERLEAAVTSLSIALGERVALESSVKEAIEVQRTLQDQLKQLRQGAARAAENFEAMRDRLKAEIAARDSDLETLEREHSRKIQDLSKQIELLSRERKGLETELKDVKRKYRSTQHQLSRDQEKLRKARSRLAEAEATIAQMRQTVGWRISSKAAALVEHTRSLMRRAIGGGDRRLREQQISQIRMSPYFDASWYLSRYTDVAGSGIDPALHYVQNGWREGRDPGPEFSTSSYLKNNPDVVQSGRNPLLHYIEFGHSEGRCVSRRSKITSDPLAPRFNTEFGPAADCTSFKVSEQTAMRWTRSARLQSDRGDLLSIGDVNIGYSSDSEVLASVQGAFDCLSRLSGYSDGRSVGELRDMTYEARLIDAWLTGDGRLRSRWNAESEGLVVRAYQHVVEKSGVLELVGEALLRSEIDFLDARLRNPLFPVLLVLSDPNGTLRGAMLLTFPSLCRGGLHNSELLALAGKDGSDPIEIVALGWSLADQLFALLDGRADPLVGGIRLDLSGGDGAERLFQGDLRSWLQKVMRVGIDPELAPRNQRNVDYLMESARLEGVRPNAVGKLSLAADMIPTIGALVAVQGNGDLAEGEVVLPMLIGGSEPSAPAALIQLPVVDAHIFKAGAPNYPAPWCLFSPLKPFRLNRQAPIGAIREQARSPTDAELLSPVAQPIQIVAPTQGAISWLIAVDDDGEDHVAQTLEALALQVVSTPSAVLLIGDVAPGIFALAKNLFDDRASLFSDVAVALAEVGSPLVGYLAPDVILHDDRTAQVLASILEDPAAASASCVIVATERRGKGWHVSVADQGVIPGDLGIGDASWTKLFWRANYPAAQPPRDLWVGRTLDVRGWLQRAGPLQAREGMHVCTSQVTAAYLSESGDRVPFLRPPVAQCAMRLERVL